MRLDAMVTLNDNSTIPQVGFGTWQLNDETALRTVQFAMSLGVRHIDTAAIYDNESAVGEAIQKSGIARNKIFLTSKVWNDDQGYDTTIQACKESLRQLNTGYLDLYLVHWPVADQRVETYKALETLQKDGLVKSIGVSNFMVNHIEELLTKTSVVPAVNQIEIHPFNYQQRKDVVEFCQEKGIAIEAYSPLVQAERFDNPILMAIAQTLRKTVPQILIRWSLQHNFVVIPRSSSNEHIRDNYDVFDFELTGGQMAEIDDLNEDLVTTMDPTNM